MTDLWTPSDDLLLGDPIALQQIRNPHDTSALQPAGIELRDLRDDAANEAAAALSLVDNADDERPAQGQSGECADDDEVADAGDAERIEATV